MLRTVYEFFEDFVNEYNGHSSLSGQPLSVIDEAGNKYTADYVTMGVTGGIEIHIIKDNNTTGKE